MVDCFNDARWISEDRSRFASDEGKSDRRYFHLWLSHDLIIQSVAHFSFAFSVFTNVDNKTHYIDTLHYNSMTAFGKQIENKFTFSQRFKSSQVLFFSPKFKDIQSLMGTGNQTVHQLSKMHLWKFIGFSVITVEKIVKCNRQVSVQLRNYLANC